MKEKHTDDAFTISGYICLSKDRIKRRGGGVAAFVKQDLQPTHINIQSTMQHAEDFWFAVTLTTGLIINFCNCYHPPIYDSSEFIRHLSDNIGLMLETDPDSVFVLTADLNRLDTTELQTQQGGDKIMNVPTHNNNILDQFLTNQPELFTVQVAQSLVNPLDAKLIFANFPLAPDVFSSLKNVATPRELSYL